MHFQFAYFSLAFHTKIISLAHIAFQPYNGCCLCGDESDIMREIPDPNVQTADCKTNSLISHSLTNTELHPDLYWQVLAHQVNHTNAMLCMMQTTQPHKD